MLKAATIVVGVVTLAALAGSWAAPRASTPMVRSTYQGRTAESWARAAHGWQRTAAKRSELATWLQLRLTTRVREAQTLRRAVRRLAAQDTVLTSPEERNFLCIHGGEGSWTDPNAPFWGGVQMDLGFQKTYGREFYDHYGTADHWPVSVQIAVAIKASWTRGYHPWPNTARACGLL